jgi:hypothetical protein
VKPYFEKHIYSVVDNKVKAFFEATTFNHYSDQSKNHLIMAVAELPILKNEESLTDNIKELRKTHPRSHEAWNELEVTFIKKAFENTNDLGFLSKAFKRSETSIKAFYEKMMKEQSGD